MKYLRRCLPLLLGAVLLMPAMPARAQDMPVAEKAPGKAFALSLLVPGLGHRYVNGGDWAGGATAFALADAAAWLGLAGTVWHRRQTIESYETLAATRAEADIEGKDRTFFLNLASFRSSDEFLDFQLRNRAWDQVDYVADRTYQWNWENEADFLRFRALREDAESLGRRRTFLITVLVGNRLISGLLALRAAGRSPDVALSLAPGPDRPVVNLQMRW